MPSLPTSRRAKVFAREEQQVWVCRNCGLHPYRQVCTPQVPGLAPIPRAILS